MTLKDKLLCSGLGINFLSIDIVLSSYVPSFLIKLIVLFTIFLAVKRFAIGTKSNQRLFFITLLYSIYILLSEIWLMPEAFTGESISSIAALVIPAFLFRFQFRDDSNTAVLKTFILMPILVVCFGLILYLLIGRPIFRLEYDGTTRLQGGSIPAHLGMICFISIFALNLLYIKGHLPKKKFYIFYIITYVILFLSGARMALVCSFLSTIVFVYQYWKANSTIKIILSTLTFISFIVYVILKSSRSGSLGNADVLVNTSGRTDAWAFFYQVFLDNPVLGIGAGNSSKFFRNSDIEFFVTPHNEYLRLLVEGGLIGTAIVSFFMFRYIFFKLMLYKRTKSENVFQLLTLYACTLIFSFTDNTFSTYQYYIPFLYITHYLGRSLIREAVNRSLLLNSKRGFMDTRT